MLSIILFLVALAIIVPIFGQVSDRISQVNAQREMETRATFVSEALIKTGGYPHNWTAETVRTAGFVDDGRLNLTKFEAFLDLPYGQAQAALALAGVRFNLSLANLQGYGVYTGISDAPVAYLMTGNTTALPHLEHGIVWDLYYAGAGAPPPNSARIVRTGADVDMFNDMVANQSAYKTIVIEDSSLAQAQVDIEKLKDFVQTGGVLVVTGSAALVSTGFSMTMGQELGATGTVVDGYELLNASAGAAVTFNSSRWYAANASGGAPLRAMVVSQTNASRALIASWEHGTGTVYFITDAAGAVDGRDLTSLLSLVGRKLEHGTEPSQASIVMVSNRHAVLRKHHDQYVTMRLIIWV